MSPFFRRNLSTAGRLVRGAGGLLSLGAALYLREDYPRVCLVLAVFGLFSIFQSLRGWCLLRACGMKTPL